MFGLKSGLDKAVDFAHKVVCASMYDRHSANGLFLQAVTSDPYLAGYVTSSIEFESYLASKQFSLQDDNVRLIMAGVAVRLFTENKAKTVFDYVRTLENAENQRLKEGETNAERYFDFKSGRKKMTDDPEYSRALAQGKELMPGAPNDIAPLFGFQFFWFDSAMITFAYTRNH